MMLIGHRGTAGTAPENTLASFRQAVADGADWIEMDVCESKDGEIVVIHDDTLDRTTNGTGLVRDHPLSQLKRLDAGSFFHRRFAGERIPTLREVIRMVKPTRAGLFIEMKSGPHLGRGFERKLVALLERESMGERCFLISFDHAAVRRVKELQPRCRTLVLIGRRRSTRKVLTAIQSHRADGVAIKHTLCGHKLVRGAHSCGFTAVVWTVNRPRTMRRCLKLGVDGIASDYPARLAKVISRTAARHPRSARR